MIELRFRLNKALVILITAIAVLQLNIPAFASTAEMLDEWSSSASRAEEILEANLASTSALEVLLGELSEQRAQAAELEAASREKINPLRAQLLALGEPPAEGSAPEADEVSARRSDLNRQISEATVPLLVAQAAYKRADGLIKRINEIIRSRFQEKLVALGPTPLNPVLWPDAISSLTDYGSRVFDEIKSNFSNPSSLKELKQKAPLALLVFILGLWILLGLRRSFSPIIKRALAYGDEPMLWQAALSNMARLFVPLVGAVAVVFAISASGLLGLSGQALQAALPYAAFAIVLAPWLGRTIFNIGGVGGAIDGDSYETSGYRICYFLGITYALYLLLESANSQSGFTPETQAVLHFPLIVLSSIGLFQLSRLIRRKIKRENNGEEIEVSVFAYSDFVSRVLFIVSLVAPVLAGVGYFAAAKFLIYPMILSLALLAGLLVVFDFFKVFLDHWTRTEEREIVKQRFQLVPVFVGFIMTLAAIPLLALIWGARVSDLQEIWVWVNEGVSIGESKFSISELLVFVFVFGLGYTITRLVQKTVRNSVLPKTRLDIGGKTAVLAGIGYSGIFFAALAAISATGLDLSSLAIVAGALSVGIGFGLQTIVSNFVSGIILLVERPIKEGDWIQAGGFEGIVRKISVRATLIDTFDRCAVIIPNSELIAGSVLNWTSPDKTGRVKVPVGVAYGSSPERVKEILLSIAEGHPDTLKYPAPSVIFTGFGASSLDFEIRAFLRDVNSMLSARSEMNFEISRRFEEEGIEIPFAQSDITIRNADDIGVAMANMFETLKSSDQKTKTDETNN